MAMEGVMDPVLDAGQRFFKSALVQWTLGFCRPSNPCQTLDELADGIFLNEWLADMDPINFSSILAHVKEDVNGDPILRQHNLTVLLEGLTGYYQEVLQMIILMELPVISAIVRDPLSEAGIESLQRFLNLILGCAIHCERREQYITNIKDMNSELQLEMMGNIQTVMQGLLRVPWNSLDSLSVEELVTRCQDAYGHLNRAVVDRDTYAQKLDDLHGELAYLQSGTAAGADGDGKLGTKRHSGDLDSSLAGRHFETIKELKRQIGSLTEELEQKVVLTDELLAEDSKNKHTNSALSIKVRQLSLAAEEARALRDDLDVWKARAQLNERNKTEIERFREKMEDFDYVKRAYEELKAQASLLVQQNENLKESQKDTDALHSQVAASDREGRVLKIQIQELNAAQEVHFSRIRELNSVIVRLESEKIHVERERELLLQELTSLKQQTLQATPLSSLTLDHVPRYEFLRLETENMDLKRKLDRLELSSTEAQRTLGQTEELEHKLHNTQQQVSAIEKELCGEQEKNRVLHFDLLRLQDTMSKSKTTDASPARNDRYSKEKQRLLALESKLDSAVNKSVELKEERIRVLEDRLEDVMNQNALLKEDFKLYKKQNDMLRQQAGTTVPGSPPPLRHVAATRATTVGSVGSPLASRSRDEGSKFEQLKLQQALEESELFRQENRSLKEQLQTRSREHETAIQDQHDVLKKMNLVLSADRDSLRSKCQTAEAANTRLRDREARLQERVKILDRFRLGLEQENKDLMAQLNAVLLQQQELLFKVKDSPPEGSLEVDDPAPDPLEKDERVHDAKYVRNRKGTANFFKNVMRRKKGESQTSAGGPSSKVPARPDVVVLGLPLSPATAPSVPPIAGPSPMSEVIGVEQMLIENKGASQARTPARFPGRSRQLLTFNQQRSGPYSQAYNLDPDDSRQDVLQFLLEEHAKSAVPPGEGPQIPDRTTSLRAEPVPHSGRRESDISRCDVLQFLLGEAPESKVAKSSADPPGPTMPDKAQSLLTPVADVTVDESLVDDADSTLKSSTSRAASEGLEPDDESLWYEYGCV